MHHTLTSMFAGLFRKQGFEVTEYDCLELVEFESYWIKGQVMFDKSKVHRVRWRCKPGYYLFDAPMAPGFTSVEFKKATDLLLFLQRRLVWKKKH
jgi:hypothetical protein